MVNIGDKFGKLTVIENSRTRIKNSYYYKVRCECGNERWMPASQIMDSTEYQSCRRCANGKTVSNFRESFINRLRGNAILRNKEFAEDVTPEYLYDLLELQDFKCALTGDNLLPEDGSLDHVRKDLPLSLDRIDSSKGYIRGNLQWVTKRVNWMKGDMSTEELFEMCNKILNHANQQPSQPLTKLEGSETNS